jgi:hypothetical protein
LLRDLAAAAVSGYVARSTLAEAACRMTKSSVCKTAGTR